MSAGHAPIGWRGMRGEDIPAVAALAALVHPGLPEDDMVFANRIVLYPQGCLVLDEASAILGYAVAHPSLRYEPPALNTILAALPPAPDNFYLHDFVLAPETRGSGQAAAGIARLLDLAAGFPTASLISVYGTAPFWRRFGFVRDASGRIGPKLAGYGDGAVYMLRDNVRQSRAKG